MDPEATRETRPGRHTASRGIRSHQRPAHRRGRQWSVLVGVPLLIGISATGTVFMISDMVERQKTGSQAPVFTDSASPTISPTPGPDAPKAGEFGTAVKLDVIDVTVYEYKAAGSDDGDQLGSLEIKTCNTSDETLTVGPGPWSMVFPDDTVADAGKTRQGFTEPEYPSEARRLKPDKCVRGWLTFELSEGRKPVEVAYQPGDREAEPGKGSAAPAVTWRVP